jgi:hypothetical protein
MRDAPLLAWQWQHYPENHVDRGNLIIHVITVPLFWLGLAATIAAAPTGQYSLFAAGPILMAAAMISQGRGHKRERVPPIPFDGPLDVVKRIFVEQLITWPRFFLSGGAGRAWRSGGGAP